MNITITGDIGSGKSTIANRLAELLNMQVVETGDIYRKYADTKGLNVLTQNRSDDYSIDRKIDSEIEEMGKTVNNTIFVSRLAWHFIPKAFHIYLVVNPVLAAKRISEDKKRVSEHHVNWEETLRYNEERKLLELLRYRSMYYLNDPSGYNVSDVVVVVGNRTVEQVAQLLYKVVTTRDCGFYVDPSVLVPSQSIKDYNMNTLALYTEHLKDCNDVYVDMGVYVSSYKHIYYVNDGHHRVLASVHKGIPFMKTNTPDEVVAKPTFYNFYDYEDMANVSLENERLLCESFGVLDDVVFDMYKRKYNIKESNWESELARLQWLACSDLLPIVANYVKDYLL